MSDHEMSHYDIMSELHRNGTIIPYRSFDNYTLHNISKFFEDNETIERFDAYFYGRLMREF